MRQLFAALLLLAACDLAAQPTAPHATARYQGDSLIVELRPFTPSSPEVEPILYLSTGGGPWERQVSVSKVPPQGRGGIVTWIAHVRPRPEGDQINLMVVEEPIASLESAIAPESPTE